jgi:D-glycero-alpha-D-manno-heptose-7-phosphate kinase
MIITKTPLRVSFAGGGTDLKAFYEIERGAVLSTGINKYVNIAVHKSFEEQILLKYSKTEQVKTAEEIQHTRIKQCFLKTDTKDYLEVTSFADVPSAGTGLGSSSAFTIGMLKALYTLKHKNKDNITLAKEACEIEIEELHEPIGKQDQYACAVGGMNLISFEKDGNVFVEPVTIPRHVKKELNENLMMFYTGITRSASKILSEQRAETVKENKFKNLVKMRDLAFELRDTLVQQDISSFGEILHKGWLLKKELASGISTGFIDGLYDKAIQAGAYGGKVLGAGGGGFLLFYCPPEKQDALRKTLELREMKFRFDAQGSRIIYMEDDDNE